MSIRQWGEPAEVRALLRGGPAGAHRVGGTGEQRARAGLPCPPTPKGACGAPDGQVWSIEGWPVPRVGSRPAPHMALLRGAGQGAAWGSTRDHGRLPAATAGEDRLSSREAQACAHCGGACVCLRAHSRRGPGERARHLGAVQPTPHPAPSRPGAWGLVPPQGCTWQSPGRPGAGSPARALTHLSGPPLPAKPSALQCQAGGGRAPGGAPSPQRESWVTTGRGRPSPPHLFASGRLPFPALLQPGPLGLVSGSPQRPAFIPGVGAGGGLAHVGVRERCP